MFIEEIYNHRVFTTSFDTSIKEAVKMLIHKDCNGLVVMNGDKVVGVLALQDIAGATVPSEFRENVNLANAMYRKGMFKEICMDLATKKVSDIMRKDFMSVSLQTNILAVMADFLKNDLYIVPVVEKMKLIGVIARNDIKKAIAIKMEIEH